MSDGVRRWCNSDGDSLGSQKINFVDGEAVDEREENAPVDFRNKRRSGRSDNMDEIAVCVCGNSEFEISQHDVRCVRCGESYKWTVDKDTEISKLPASGIVELVNSASYGKVEGL